MITNKPKHLGDGAYVGGCPYVDQIWLGANHHENMSVALGPRETLALIEYVLNRWPHLASEVKNTADETINASGDKFAWKAGDVNVE